jgi:hypothetical protein
LLLFKKTQVLKTFWQAAYLPTATPCTNDHKLVPLFFKIGLSTKSFSFEIKLCTPWLSYKWQKNTFEERKKPFPDSGLS